MRYSFNDHWNFRKAEERERIAVTLPHDAMIHEARTPKAGGQSASGFFPGGHYIYEKEFEVTEDMSGKKITFEFEGAYKNAKVFINNKEAGRAAYGYLPFFIEADGYLTEGRNTIRVETDNAKQPDSRWYSGAGLYRPVWLHVQEQTRIALKGIKIRTISIAPPQIEICTEHNGGEIRVEILDHYDKNEEQALAQAKGDRVSILLEDAKLWSAEHPHLYTAKVSLTEDGKTVEERLETFGIRKISWNRNGLFVNGENTLLKGGCIHHDNGILGACEYEESAYRRIRILKQSYNAIRCAHNPASTALLKACDELGMYVMDETWDMWYRKKNPYDYANEFMEHYKSDLRAMVEHDYNHPSVIMYSIGNEVSEPAEKRGVDLAVEMKDYLHEMDEGRAVCGGFNLMIIGNSAKGNNMYKEEGGRDDSGEKKAASMNSTMFNMVTSMVGSSMNNAANSAKIDKVVSPILDAMDIAGYNYASGRYKMEGKLHPRRVIVGSETFPQDLAKNWEMVKAYPYLIGDFMWTAWDYLGEAGIGTWSYEADAKGFNKPFPWLLADTGAYDILGNPNGEALWAKAVWEESGKPYLAVRPCNHPKEKLVRATWRGTNAIPSWSWKGCEGNKAVVEVYSSAAFVELYLNRKKAGKKKTKNSRAVFKVKYQPGELMARTFGKDGKEVGHARLLSAEPEAIVIRPEKKSVKPGEIIYIAVNLADSRGIVQSNADTKLHVEVSGGELLGFGSANPRTEERFGTGEYSTWYGRSQAVIRAGSEHEITVKVTGKGYEKAEMRIPNLSGKEFGYKDGKTDI